MKRFYAWQISSAKWVEITEEKFNELKIYLHTDRLKIEDVKSYAFDLQNTPSGNNLADSQATALFNTCKTLLMVGQKIEAIKLVRIFTNLGLKESKDWVEAIELPTNEYWVNGFIRSLKNYLDRNYPNIK